MRSIFLKQMTAALALAVSCLAVETKFWEHSTSEDFENGVLQDLSLRSDGRLMLAPRTRQLLDGAVASLWAVAEDSDGNLWVGGGGPGSTAARLYRIAPDGNSETVAELEGLQVQAIAIDADDRIYAATAPDGKVYRLTDGSRPEVFYDPGTKYIWAIAFDTEGALLVGTGDGGELHRVTPDGEGSVLFRTEETHVRSLAVDSSGNAILGTEPGGLIIRVSPEGSGFVLYQSAKREITSVAVDSDGFIYAAGVGNKTPTAAATRVAQPAAAPNVTSITVTAEAPQEAPGQPGEQTQGQEQQQQQLQALAAAPQLTVVGGSEVYRIDPEGQPRTLWSDNSEIVFSLAIDESGRPVFGTGNDGKIYRLDTDRLYTQLVDLPPSQVTGIARGRNGRLVALTGNVGRAYQLGPEQETEGSYLGEVLDANYFSYWGRVSFRGDAGAGNVAIEARSGNLDRPQQNWSPWSAVDIGENGERIGAPSARFLQYRVTLTAGSGEPAPEVNGIEVAYLQKNLAPSIDILDMTPPDYQFPPQAYSISGIRNLTLTPLGSSRRNANGTSNQASGGVTPQTMQAAEGYLGARWRASDENGDTLAYKVEIRPADESDWITLEDELENPHISWDSTAFPDGEYQLRITVTDLPSNPPPLALTGQRVSEPFLVDNTAPEILELAGSRADGRIAATWNAADESSVIAKAEYSVDGGDWTVIEPTTHLSDQRSLSYELDLPDPGAGEHTVAVRVTDRLDNQAVARAVVR